MKPLFIVLLFLVRIFEIKIYFSNISFRYLINRITKSAKTQKFGQKDASLMHSHHSHFNVPQESYFTKICK